MSEFKQDGARGENRQQAGGTWGQLGENRKQLDHDEDGYLLLVNWLISITIFILYFFLLTFCRINDTVLSYSWLFKITKIGLTI